MSHAIRLLSIVLLIALLTACASGQLAEQENDNIKRLNQSEKEQSTEAEDSSDEDISGQSNIDMLTIRQTGITVYFLDEAAGQLSAEQRKASDSDFQDDLAENVLKELIEGPETNGLSPVMPEDVRVNGVESADNILYVDLSAEFYGSKDPGVARAALVNSLLELGAYKYVKLYVDGSEITDTSDARAGALGLLSRYPLVVSEIKALEAQNYYNSELRRIDRELFFQDYSGKFLLPEVRTITVRKGGDAEAIVNELIKGPMAEGEGYHPILPKGTILEKYELVQGNNDTNGIALYFSKEFRSQFSGGAEQEYSIISSLVYSLSLPDIHFIRIYYNNGTGEYINEPVYKTPLNMEFTTGDFPARVGRKIRVYFGDGNSGLLAPEYRAVDRNELRTASRILSELASDPIGENHVRVIPPHVEPEDFQVKVLGKTAVVDVPADYFTGAELDNRRFIRDIYAVVNTLTDPVNDMDIQEVQFTVDGDVLDSYMDISLRDTFVFNPALIKEE